MMAQFKEKVECLRLSKILPVNPTPHRQRFLRKFTLRIEYRKGIVTVTRRGGISRCRNLEMPLTNKVQMNSIRNACCEKINRIR